MRAMANPQRTDGNSDIASGVEDLRAAMPVIAHETGQTRCHFMGESSGALRAGAFAMAEPDHVGRMVLTALTYTGKGSPTLAKRAEQVEYYKTHNRRLRDRAMIESIFTRDKPGTTDPAVGAAVANMELVHGDTVPTGTYLDMTAHLPVIDPTKIAAPVAVMRGEFDGIATMEDLWDFFEKLPNGDKQFSVIAGGGACAGDVPQSSRVLARGAGVPDDAGRTDSLSRVEPSSASAGEAFSSLRRLHALAGDDAVGLRTTGVLHHHENLESEYQAM